MNQSYSGPDSNRLVAELKKGVKDTFSTREAFSRCQSMMMPFGILTLGRLSVILDLFTLIIQRIE
jgi:hypothetical protein